jgi:biotin carboxylase
LKKIAVLGAGIYNILVYKKLREGGFYTIAVDGNENAPAASHADEFVHLNFTDKEKLRQYFTQHPVHGIMPVNDWGTIPAAYASHALGLLGISETAAMASCDKGIMRDTWKKTGLPVPDYFVFSTLAELKEKVSHIGFPCVIKPTYSGGGGRGISVLKSQNDVEWAYEFAKPYVKNERFICEAFVEGTELTIETISIDGEVHVLAISDKYKPDLRTRVATSLNYPAALSADQEALVVETVKKAVLALGIHTGMAHTEAIIQGMEMRLVETGARGGGSHIFPLIIEAVSGINAPVLLANLLSGGNTHIPVIQKQGVVYRFFNPEPGILKGVKNMEEVKNWPGILDIGMLKKSGEAVGDLKNSFERAGHLVAAGVSRDSAIALADRAEKAIEFEVEDQYTN